MTHDERAKWLREQAEATKVAGEIGNWRSKRWEMAAEALRQAGCDFPDDAASDLLAVVVDALDVAEEENESLRREVKLLHTMLEEPV
jgi:uncharacterized protein HemY